MEISSDSESSDEEEKIASSKYSNSSPIKAGSKLSQNLDFSKAYLQSHEVKKYEWSTDQVVEEKSDEEDSVD